jgi:hypothetical protein
MRRMQTKRIVMLMLVGLTLTCPARFQAFGGDTQQDRDSLRGLQGIHVIVETIKPDAERDGLKKHQVQTDVELRLRQSGIRVLSQEETFATPGSPLLYISVNTSKSNIPLYAYSVSVELHQDVWMVRDLNMKPVMGGTWSSGGTGSVGQDNIAEVRENVLDNIDRFINAYLAVNPEQAGAGRRSRGPENLIPEASIIRKVQWQLREAGFEPGQVDGKLGTQTRLALQQYQTQKGLPPSGELDNATSRALGLR